MRSEGGRQDTEEFAPGSQEKTLVYGASGGYRRTCRRKVEFQGPFKGCLKMASAHFHGQDVLICHFIGQGT